MKSQKQTPKTWNQDHTKDSSSCLLFIHFVFSHNVVFTYFFYLLSAAFMQVTNISPKRVKANKKKILLSTKNIKQKSISAFSLTKSEYMRATFKK